MSEDTKLSTKYDKNLLIKGNDVIGLKVIALDSGEEVEKVQDIIYDPQDNSVKALLIDTGGWFSEAKVVPISTIESIGKDAVIVKSSDVFKKASDLSERVHSITKGDEYLTKTRILTEEGNDLGEVNDILFEPLTGIVREFEVSQGSLQDIGTGKKRVKVSDIVTVGKDATIVKAYAEEYIDTQSQEKGVQGAINTSLDRGKTAFEKFGRKLSEGTKSATTQVKEQYSRLTSDENKQYIKDRAKSFEDLVTKEAKLTNDQIREKYNELTSEENKEKYDKYSKEAQSKTKDYYDMVSQQVESFASRVLNEARDTFSNLQTRVDQFQESENFQNTQSTVREKSQQAQQAFYTQIDRARENRKSKMVEDAAGQYLTKNILLPNDKILARRGAMVTHKMLETAEENGIIDQVLNNTSPNPID